MRPGPTRGGWRRTAAIVGAAALLAWLALLRAPRSCAPGLDRHGEPPGPGLGARAPPPASPSDGGGYAWDPSPRPPSFGWEVAAETVVADLQRLLSGRARAGAFAEAQADAARQDLARFPPARTRVRRMLLGTEQERRWALAAAAALPDPGDDLVRLILRSQRPEDDELVRLLGAEFATSLPPELLSRHADDLLRAFEREPNPLVLAVAMPALERLDDERLRALMAAQLELGSAEMLPILVGFARDRLGPEALEDVGILVRRR